MSKIPSYAELAQNDAFVPRHIGPNANDIQAMLEVLGVDSVDALIDNTVPATIRNPNPLNLAPAVTEDKVLEELKGYADRNKVYKSFIGAGYYRTITPAVIQRNILENPAWYTAYTPYQPEISQGRLEALLNFQTMIADLTGMEIANASLLDEATAAAEAMALCRRMNTKNKSLNFFVADDCHPQTIEVVKGRAAPLDINVIVAPAEQASQHDSFAVLLQYPGTFGDVRDYKDLIKQCHDKSVQVIMAADILALTMLTSPGELGADVAVGSSQRFGVPLFFGGPHAAYMATKDQFRRSLPGRLVGVSIDSNGESAYRLALQTREQHIRRQNATSNICTAQALLAVIASMYACYHGPEGLKRIAQRIHRLACSLKQGLQAASFDGMPEHFFDTLTVSTGDKTDAIYNAALAAEMNLRRVGDDRLGISLDETTTAEDVVTLLKVFGQSESTVEGLNLDTVATAIPASLERTSPYLEHPVFSQHHSETAMLRYLRSLADKDLALDRTMIPLGSCTMKLNATTEMMPVSWPEFCDIHPFVPLDQSEGYRDMIASLEDMLCEATGYDACSLQPNAGSQGEYAGLLAIRAYHVSRGEGQRNVCLIPSSAHGTNPASAQMVGMKVVVVACDSKGNVDLNDLREKAEKHSEDLAAIMVTYPSTHGVFEEGIREVCDIIHHHGGQVYIDGANLNAMVGLCQPGKFGGDVSHLNLHKTFCIPHGGGGPGVGPVAVAEHLAPFLPGHPLLVSQSKERIDPVSAAPYGSAGILPISWTYMRMMGPQGLAEASRIAILSANYVSKRLSEHYPVLYTGTNGYVAHECIVDMRGFKDSVGVTVDDIAKRLIDFGFHAPTMSFPVPGTLMIEPTESESKEELDRFCDAMIAIREEIRAVERGEYSIDSSPLRMAPHTTRDLVGEWNRPYTREQGVFPVASLPADKYWCPVGRIDNVYGDRNLVCSCPSMSDYE
ncbi:aminomethyl-transferring glycine dehydrogenase [Hahella ganghwensis]|uniref:aminomethyl-transferring glycine dehydrogenase n=1 Tax=Hahella ganghwensis TaxID=286420 RepID=UPI00035DC4F5|nr:aminomethyl-transferring glycine dehydrogenase [Hahella ganghwensis]